MHVKRGPSSEFDMAPGGKKHSPRNQRNLKLALRPNPWATSYEVTKPKPNVKVKLHINIKNPTSLIFFEILHVIAIEHQPVLPRENPAHVVRALCVLAEGVAPCDQVRWGEPHPLVGHVALHLVVVDVEFFVRVSCSEIENEIVAEHVNVIIVVGGEVELGEFGVGDMELEGAWLDHSPEDEEYDNEEDDDGKEKLPEEAEEATAAASATVVVTWQLRWRDCGAVIRTV